MLLTTTQLAKELGVHPITIRRMVKRGDIPFYKTGTGQRSNYRFILDEVIKNLN